MICKVSKEEAAAVNALADQAFALISGAVGSAKGLISMTSIPECHKARAIMLAAINMSLITALNHRISHGEMKGLNGLKALKTDPAAIKNLIEDINDIFAQVLRAVDPEHDYMLNVFKIEKLGNEKDGQGKTL